MDLDDDEYKATRLLTGADKLSEEEIVKSKMQEIANMIEKNIPEKWGFTLLTFPFYRDGEVVYVSNANRQDIINVMAQWIKHANNNCGNDTEKH